MMGVRATTAQRRQGFTLIEVMVSLGVMTIGAMAILALQQQSVRSNAHARQITIATQIAERWAERFKQDAQTWNAVGLRVGAPNLQTVLGGTTWLQQIIAQPNVFQTIGNTGNNISNAFDYQGFDVPNTGNYYYCASFRPSWVYYGRAMRIDIRVWWARQNIERTSGAISNITAAPFAGCNDPLGVLDPGGTQYANYHVVYLPTVVRMVDPQ
jgi:prepilin-type N-terminal cleavage/methylation domain-containing protein